MVPENINHVKAFMTVPKNTGPQEMLAFSYITFLRTLRQTLMLEAKGRG